jgi:hypothetical protein
LGALARAEHSELFSGIEGVGGRHYVLQIQELTHENIMLLIWWDVYEALHLVHAASDGPQVYLLR